MDKNTILTFRQKTGYRSDLSLDLSSVLIIRGTMGTIAPFLTGKMGEIFREETDSCGCCSTDILVAKVEDGVICFEPVSSWDPTPLEELSQHF
jgi:hypothetical protein